MEYNYLNHITETFSNSGSPAESLRTLSNGQVTEFPEPPLRLLSHHDYQQINLPRHSTSQLHQVSNRESLGNVGNLNLTQSRIPNLTGITVIKSCATYLKYFTNWQ